MSHLNLREKSSRELFDAVLKGHTNNKEALKELQKRADNNEPQSQINLAYLCFNGKVENHGRDAAFRLFIKAAEQGYAEAQHQTGCCYEKEGDYKKSFEWNLKAAKQGNIIAILAVKKAYENGIGVEQNISKSIKWAGRLQENASSHYNVIKAREGLYYVINNI